MSQRGKSFFLQTKLNIIHNCSKNILSSHQKNDNN
nr:MAG TPA: hypothetical protein [Caudoviricetes sp.]